MIPTPDDLRAIYLDTLDACAPARLVAGRLPGLPLPDIDLDFIAVGKCAEEMARGVLESRAVRRGLILIPRGYSKGLALPAGVERVEGTHPLVTRASAEAAGAAIEFARASDRPVLVLVSGGASASVETPLEPWLDLDDVAAINARLVGSGLDIEAINTVRKHISAVKGGRFGALLPVGSIALVHSDVARGRIDLVGSGLVVADATTNADAARILDAIDDDVCRRVASLLRTGQVPDTPKRLSLKAFLVADNGTLVDAACRLAGERGFTVVRVDREVEGDVEIVARSLAARAASLRGGELLVAGGEPTVVVRGPGQGGRCSELAVRFARHAGGSAIGLFGSSDGIDGSSPAGAVLATREIRGDDRVTSRRIDDALARSASYELVGLVGEPIIIGPTGNNLRDIFLVARGPGRAV